jgi:hypothetical protein
MYNPYYVNVRNGYIKNKLRAINDNRTEIRKIQKNLDVWLIRRGESNILRQDSQAMLQQMSHLNAPIIV